MDRGKQIRYLMDVLQRKNQELKYLRKIIWHVKHRASDSQAEDTINKLLTSNGDHVPANDGQGLVL